MAFVMENFFDFREIFVNELIGSLALFIIVVIIILWILAALNKMPASIPLMATGLFMIIVVIEFAHEPLWVLVITVIGLLFYFGLRKALDLR